MTHSALTTEADKREMGSGAVSGVLGALSVSLLLVLLWLFLRGDLSELEVKVLGVEAVILIVLLGLRLALTLVVSARLWDQVETTRTRAERALRALQGSQAQLKTMVENAPVILLSMDREGVITFTDGSGLKELGSYPGKGVGLYIFDFCANNPALAEDIRRALQGEEITATAGLGDRFFETHYRPVRDELGTVQEVIAIAFDVTERKQAEEALQRSEESVRQLIRDMNVGVIVQGPQAEILAANPASLQMLGLTEAQLLGMTSFDPNWNVIHEDGSDFPGDSHPVPLAIATRRPVQQVVMGVFRPRSGDRVWLLVDAVPELDAGGNVRQVVCTFVDISERKRAEEALRESDERFMAQYRGIPVPTYTWRQVENDWVLIDYNDAADQATEGTARNLLGIHARHLYGHDAERLEDFDRCTRERTTIRREVHYRYRELGKEADLLVNYVFVPPDVVMVHTEDITERKRMQATLEHRATHDALTDLPNRMLLERRAQNAIEAAGAPRNHFSLLLLDLDRFKELNDTFGHRHGDTILQQLGERLRQIVREKDTVARLGGDEFAVLMPETDVAGATMAAGRILRSLAEPFAVAGQDFVLEGSVGISMFPDHGRDFNVLFQAADVAMYRAKQESAGYVVYDKREDPHSPERLQLINDLHHALGGDELFLTYQPKVHLKTDQVQSVESLIRWRHPVQGFVSPGQFIPLAEHTGLIKPLTQWVLDEALWQSRAWNELGIDVNMAVNLSARNLQDPQLVSAVASLIEARGRHAPSLTLEITESAIILDPERAMETVTQLHDMGVRISIDDFGTGYSSLAYLKRLPVDEVKIDRTFVMDLAANENDASIVRSIIELGHNLGLQVVAEGVEDEATWDMLLAMGCDVVQGYHLARPMLAGEFLCWLNERSAESAA